METSQLQKLERVKARVAEMKSFYTHLTVYLIFVCVFIALNYYSGGFWWAVFPIIGWGIGIAGHAANTFQWNPLLSKDWEKRKIEEYMQNDNF